MWTRRITVLALAAGAASAALANSQAAAPASFEVCYDFSCRSQATITLSSKDWGRVQDLFAIPALTASEERETIAQAVALLEQLSSAQSGIGRDLGGNLDGHGLPGQMDCIDESTNTSTYLQLLDNAGLLLFHRVGERAYRAPWIFDQHWSATVVAHDGQPFAVDSWFLDNGRRPYVQALPAWLKKADLPYNPDADG